MQYTYLGKTGRKVSRICLGTMSFGNQNTREEAFRIMDTAYANDLNFWDSANSYGPSESIIGEWFKKNRGKRENIVMGSKVSPNSRDPLTGSIAGLTAKHIRQTVDESLRRLKTDYVDLYQLHSLDPKTPWEEIWPVLQSLVQEGKILYCGSSNFDAWHIAYANGKAAQHGFPGLVCEQHHYNLLGRTAEADLLACCGVHGMGVITYGPVGGGLLSGKLYQKTIPKRARRKGLLQQDPDRMEKLRPTIEKYEALCSKAGHAPADVAIAWVLRNKHITAPIVGPRTVAHVKGALHATDVELDDRMVTALDKLFPGPARVEKSCPGTYRW